MSTKQVIKQPEVSVVTICDLCKGAKDVYDSCILCFADICKRCVEKGKAVSYRPTMGNHTYLFFCATCDAKSKKKPGELRRAITAATILEANYLKMHKEYIARRKPLLETMERYEKAKWAHQRSRFLEARANGKKAKVTA